MSHWIRFSYVATGSLMALALVALFATQVSPAAAPPDSAVKIGVIDTEKILLSSSTGKAALASLKKLQESKENEGKGMGQEIKDLQTKIEAGRQSLPQDQLAQLQKQLDDKQTAFRRFQDDATRELNKKRDEMLGVIDVKVMPVINQIGREMGFTAVFRKFESGLIYADDSIDVTALVIQRLDTGVLGQLPPNPPGAPGSSIPPSTSGNVGLGTASPNAKLDIKQSSDGFLGGIHLRRNATNDTWALVTGRDNNLYMGYGTDASLADNHADFTVIPLVLTANNRVGIGTVTPDQKLSVNGDASKTGGGSWQTFSDERLKRIKGDFTSGLKAVMQLQPLRYEYRKDNALGLENAGEHVGFGAQAVQKVIPEAVTQTGSGYLMVNNDPILWTMLNAIKEQQKEIVELKGQIQDGRQKAAARLKR
jgi:Skp family chaperone for outer membrane proteins